MNFLADFVHGLLAFTNRTIDRHFNYRHLDHSAVLSIILLDAIIVTCHQELTWNLQCPVTGKVVDYDNAHWKKFISDKGLVATKMRILEIVFFIRVMEENQKTKVNWWHKSIDDSKGLIVKYLGFYDFLTNNYKLL